MTSLDRIILLSLALVIPLAGCATRPGRGPIESVEEGEIELVGSDSKFWSDGSPAARQNFVWEYETVAWRGRGSQPFHRMKTEIRLTYDSEAGVIRTARMIATEPGHAFRHVCLSPAGPVLHMRLTTLLDDRPSDLTVMKIHDEEIDVHACADIGVGPRSGLVEGLDVLFKKDGTFAILPGTGAYLAGANLTVERTMTRGSDRTDRVTERFP